jgi:hypothetical protein
MNRIAFEAFPWLRRPRPALQPQEMSTALHSRPHRVFRAGRDVHMLGLTHTMHEGCDFGGHAVEYREVAV